MSGVVTVSRALTPRNWTSTSDPTNGWDAADGVRVGDHWYNTTTGNVWVNVSNAVGAAVWRHIPRILGQSGTAIAHTGTVAETKLASVLVPAGAMGVNGILQIETTWSNTNNANNKTRVVRFGSGDNVSGTSFQGLVATTQFQHVGLQVISNSTAAVQLGWYNGGLSGVPGSYSAAGVAGAIDTTANSYVVMSGILANTGDTMTLLAYRVTLTRPDIT